MSGAPPETEKERQLRAFASRLLAWPDRDGASMVDLFPGGYSDLVPMEIVDAADLRFLGSAVRRRGDEVLHIDLLFEGDGGPNDALDAYASKLIEAGWQRVNQPGLRHGGFEAHGFPLAAVLVNVKRRSRVYIQAFLLGERSELRVMYHMPTEEPLVEDLSPDAPPGRSPLPTLKPPAGVRLQSKGSGGGGGHWSTSAQAWTEMAPMALEAHFARQVEADGWGRVSGSADESFAWSSWLKPSVPPGGEWRGTLVVLAAFPGERALSFTAEPGENKGYDKPGRPPRV